MAQSIQLRQVRPADLDACAAIERAVFLPSEAATREQIEARIRQYPEGFLVAETPSGLVVGFINTGVTAKDDIADEALKSLIGHDPRGANVVVFSVAVLPSWRGRGIAGQLIRGIIGLARHRRKSAVLLLCKVELIGFYERLGFASLSPSASSHGGFRWYQMNYPLLPAETA
jgi:ribosomal protein S18 acetylase RimI-like enzyme